ncbi:MAG: putative inorganic carbon transporter subunit DabA, partial [Polyangiales bacterium]
LYMPRSWYRELNEAGHFGRTHLQQALAEQAASGGEPLNVADVEAALKASSAPALERRALVTDIIDAERDCVHGMAWTDFVTHHLSQFCAAYFDGGQAQLKLGRTAGLYTSFHAHLQRDHSPQLLMGAASFRQHAAALPSDPDALLHDALTALGVPTQERPAYLTALLLSIGGWAAWCAYLRWQARLKGDDDGHLRELLTMRLAWEWLAWRMGGDSVQLPWRVAIARWPHVDRAHEQAHAIDHILQRAVELAYQQKLGTELAAAPHTNPSTAPVVQAVFCIDVRSERLRRALEAQSPAIHTRGFAGFFGLPAAYQPLGGRSAVPQLPALVAPSLCIEEGADAAPVATRRQARLARKMHWKRFQQQPASTFSFVEACGLFFAGKLLSHSLGLSRPHPAAERAGLHRSEHQAPKPQLTRHSDGRPLTLDDRVRLAADMLHTMGLVRDFAPLLLLVGHASDTTNNPHAAGLQCGACGGQSGEANARAAAAGCTIRLEGEL